MIRKHSLGIALAIVACVSTSAQVGKGLVDPNVAAEKEIGALPHMTPAIVKAMIDKRPFMSVTELNAFLDTCTKQKVLQPSNCPFGIEINDRIIGLPTWSIAKYPVVSLAAGTTAFEMPDTVGQAHIVVDVQSLFDGSLDTRDENVQFTVGLGVTIQPDGALAIQLH